jgi:hypothetical protein
MLPVAIIRNIRGFLGKAQIRGVEVPAFNQVLTALAIEEQDALRQAEQAPAGGASESKEE